MASQVVYFVRMHVYFGISSEASGITQTNGILNTLINVK